MATADPRLRNIKIKTNVLKRLTKEKSMYEQEVVQQEEKVDKMKAAGKDEHDVKKQIEVLEESRMMIPDCSRRIRTAFADLQNLVAQEEELKKTEEHRAAVAILAEQSAGGDQ